MFTKAHSKPFTMIYNDEIRMATYTIEPTFIAREWDRSRWAYIHPETGETLRTVFTYF